MADAAARRLAMEGSPPAKKQRAAPEAITFQLKDGTGDEHAVIMDRTLVPKVPYLETLLTTGVGTQQEGETRASKLQTELDGLRVRLTDERAEAAQGLAGQRAEVERLERILADKQRTEERIRAPHSARTPTAWSAECTLTAVHCVC